MILGIEIDGDTHAEQIEHDLKRTKILNTFGIKIVRYTNSEIMQNIEGVYDNLMKKLIEREREVKT